MSYWDLVLLSAWIWAVIYFVLYWRSTEGTFRHAENQAEATRAWRDNINVTRDRYKFEDLAIDNAKLRKELNRLKEVTNAKRKPK
jgi:hypothetical protein